MPLPFPFTTYGANRSSNSGGGGASCDFTYCYGGDWVQGKVGNYGMNFDGTDDYVIANTLATQMQSENTFSVSFWASGSSYSTNPPAFALSNASDASKAFIIYPYEGSSGDGVRIWYNGTSIIDENTATRTGWNHFAFVSDGATDHTLYANGESIGTSTTSKTLDSGLDTFTIGGSANFSQYFDGALDEVAVWDSALTPAQISVLSTGSARADSFTPPNASDGAWVTGTTGSAAVGNITSSYALDFNNGTDDYVIIDPGISTEMGGLTGWSLAGWFNVAEYPGNNESRGIFSAVNSLTYGGGYYNATHAVNVAIRGHSAESYASGTVFTVTNGADGGGRYIWVGALPSLSPKPALPNTWNHIAAVYDGAGTGNAGKCKIYINGIYREPFIGGTLMPTSMASTYTSGEVRFGKDHYTATGYDTFTGKLDQMAMWDVSLDSGDILDLFSGTLAPSALSSSNLIGYWSMDADGPGSTNVVDSSSNSLSGTLTNMDGGSTGSLLMYYDFEIGDSNPVSGNFPPNATVYDVVTASFHGPTAHTGTMTAMTQADFGAWEQGQVGKYSLVFDGVGDFVNIPSASQLPLGKGAGDMSVAAWCKQDLNTIWMQVVNRSNDTNWTTMWGLNKDGVGNMQFGVGGYGQAKATFSEQNTWAHFVGTYNNSLGKVKIYKNGVEQAEASHGAAGAATGSVRIGAFSHGPTLYAWNGNIDEVSIWNGILDTGSITNLAAKSKANAITTLPGPPESSDWLSPGQNGTGYAMRFPGSGYINISNKSDLGPSSGTVAFWAKFSDAISGPRVIAAASLQGAAGSSIETSWLLYRSATWITVAGGNPNQTPPYYGRYYYISNQPSITFTDWNHYAWTWASPVTNGGTEAKLYINGTYTGDAAATTPAPNDSVTVGGGIAGQEATLGDGWRGTYTPASGSMDEFGVWDTPLSASDIANLYGGTLSNVISSSNLILYYDFEGGPGNSTVVDRSTAGNDHSGTLISMSPGGGNEWDAATLAAYYDMECDGPGSLNLKDLSGNDLSGTLESMDAGTCGSG